MSRKRLDRLDVVEGLHATIIAGSWWMKLQHGPRLVAYDLSKNKEKSKRKQTEISA